jgi:hypothetical protein
LKAAYQTLLNAKLREAMNLPDQIREMVREMTQEMIRKIVREEVEEKASSLMKPILMIQTTRTTSFNARLTNREPGQAEPWPYQARSG